MPFITWMQIRLWREQLRAYLRAEARREREEEMRREREEAFARLLRLNYRMADAEHRLREEARNEDPLIDELGRLARKWRAEDAATYARWARHMTVAEHCTKSKSRQLHISRWFTKGVPEDVYHALMQLSNHYDLVIQHKEELRRLQVRAGDIPSVPVSHIDDDGWATNMQQLDVEFGYERGPGVAPNGFGHYVPKGEGITMIKHMVANFEARKTRLQHCSRVEFDKLSDDARRWSEQAYKYAWEQDHEPEDFEEATGEALLRIKNFLEWPFKYQPEGPGAINDAEAALEVYCSDHIPGTTPEPMEE
ncbi:hypothetical protein Q7P37_002388 [Cladosporium fusiforme]